MKRDKERIRTIMLGIQNGTQTERIECEIDSYHIDLLVQADWVECDEVFSCDSFYIHTDLRLTWKGCEVADLLSQQEQWEYLMSTPLKDAPFDMIINYLKESAHELLQIYPMD